MPQPRKYPEGPCAPMLVSVPEPIRAELTRLAHERNLNLGEFLMPYLRAIIAENSNPPGSFDHA